MKQITLMLIFVLSTSLTFGQEVEKFAHCDCEDKIDAINPELNGKYERTCFGKQIETGEFANGAKHGEWLTFSKKGNLIRKINYKNGILDGAVQIFFLTGKPKLTGKFSDGQKVEEWNYFNAKGKLIMQGNYDANKPTGTWSIYDKKGKKAIYEYNFDANTSLSAKSIRYFKDNDIVQNANTEEWYIVRCPQKTYSWNSTPLGGFDFMNDLLIEYMEVPLNFWDTYVYNTYKVSIQLKDDHSSTFSLLKSQPNPNAKENDLTFLAVTNPVEKIQNVNHSDLAMKLLDAKIHETFSLLPPWIKGNESELELELHYVINQNLH